MRGQLCVLLAFAASCSAYRLPAALLGQPRLSLSARPQNVLQMAAGEPEADEPASVEGVPEVADTMGDLTASFKSMFQVGFKAPTPPLADTGPEAAAAVTKVAPVVTPVVTPVMPVIQVWRASKISTIFPASDIIHLQHDIFPTW